MSSLASIVLKNRNHLIAITHMADVTYDAKGFPRPGLNTVVNAIPAVFFTPAAHGQWKHLMEADREHQTCSIVTATELRLRDRIQIETGEIFEIQGLSACGEYGFWSGVGVRLVEE